jgi:beta-lactamase class A
MDGGIIDEVFARAGCRGWLSAQEVDGPGEVALGGDEPVVAASVAKVPVALEFFRQVEAGRLVATERVRLRPGELTPGPVGFPTFADEVEVSLRDLARMMLVISDNAATDILLDRMGVPAVNTRVAALGLTDTVVVGTLRELVASIGRDLGFAGWSELQEAADDPRASPEYVADLRRRLVTASAFDPRRTTRTTARDMCALLGLIWRDEAGPPRACARVRELMAAQVTRHRLASGFPAGVKVSAKSGSLLGIVRNEVGVVQYPDGARYAVAVFTRADEPFRNDSEINAAIGTAAAQAVGSLRAHCRAAEQVV